MPVYLSTQADNPIENGAAQMVAPGGHGRGLNIWHASELQSVTGWTNDGQLIQEQVQIPMFSLAPWERDEIAKANSYVLGIVTGRMNRISGVDWKVQRKTDVEDQKVEELKLLRGVFFENEDPTKFRQVATRRKALLKIQQELTDVFPDLSNFESSLKRWALRNKLAERRSKQEIVDWLNELNREDDFEEFRKKWVYDLMVHGASAQYKQVGSVSDVVENIYMLPGGSVLPLREKFVSPTGGYAQMLPGFQTTLYYHDEIAFDRYIPISSRSYGLVPLDSLINKVAESLLFDQYAADRADGTKPPEKVVLFGSGNNGFGDLSGAGFDTPLPAAEQKKIETKLNTARKEAIATLSGLGQNVTVMDLSKADTFGAQSERQKQLLKDIALVFNVSNNEINLTGSEGTSGRSTSETQERIDRDKGIGPILRIMDKTLTMKVLPFRFGPGWEFKHDEGFTEAEQVEIDTKKMQSGTYSVNEIREERGDDPIEGDEFDKPQAPGGVGAEPGSNEQAPVFMRQVGG